LQGILKCFLLGFSNAFFEPSNGFGKVGEKRDAAVLIAKSPMGRVLVSF